MNLAMGTRRLALAAGGLACVSVLAGGAWAQAFPSKQVTLVVPFPPGGGPDVAARVIAEKLAPRLGQAVVVENRPGAGALLGASFVAKAAADGHTQHHGDFASCAAPGRWWWD